MLLHTIFLKNTLPQPLLVLIMQRLDEATETLKEEGWKVFKKAFN